MSKSQADGMASLQVYQELQQQLTVRADVQLRAPTGEQRSQVPKAPDMAKNKSQDQKEKIFMN